MKCKLKLCELAKQFIKLLVIKYQSKIICAAWISCLGQK